jgi:type IV secretion system protein VirB1
MMAPQQILSIFLACAPNVAPSTMHSIMGQESSGNEFAIGVNGDERLARQPNSRAEAIAWARWLLANGRSFGAGLMQIDTQNWKRFGLTPETVFEPCTNVRVSGYILTDNYTRAMKLYGPGNTALLAAISAYNTGDFHRGFSNGYVGKVLAKAGVASTDIPPLVRRKSTTQTKRPAEASPASTSEASSNQTPPSAANWQAPAVWGAATSPFTVATPAQTLREP